MNDYFVSGYFVSGYFVSEYWAEDLPEPEDADVAGTRLSLELGLGLLWGYQ